MMPLISQTMVKGCIGLEGEFSGKQSRELCENYWMQKMAFFLIFKCKQVLSAALNTRD